MLPSAHARVDELLAHHDHRPALCARGVAAGGSTAYDVAGELPWTRRETRFAELDLLDQALAAMETRHHLEALVATGRLRRDEGATPGEPVAFLTGSG